MEYIVCGIDAGTGAPIWDVFDLEFASAAPAQGGRAGSVCLGLVAHPCVRRELETYAQYVEGAVYCTTIYRVPDGADPETVATDECEMLDGVCDQCDYSGFVLPGAKDTLAHYESVTPIQLSLFEEA